MLIRDLTILKNKKIKIATATCQGSEGLCDEGVVTDLIATGHDTVFLELDSKTLISTRYIRRIEILD